MQAPPHQPRLLRRAANGVVQISSAMLLVITVLDLRQRKENWPPNVNRNQGSRQLQTRKTTAAMILMQNINQIKRIQEQLQRRHHGHSAHHWQRLGRHRQLARRQRELKTCRQRFV